MNNYTVSIGPWHGRFKVGLSAAAPTEQLHAFLCRLVVTQIEYCENVTV